MLFKTVHKHLRKDGQFIFDYRDNYSSTPITYSPLITWTDTTPKNEQRVLMVQECNNFLESKSIVNCYSEIKSNGRKKRLFSYSEKAIFTFDGLQKIVHKTGLKIVETREMIIYENEKLKIVVLGKV